jgi:hypothetical protein
MYRPFGEPEAPHGPSDQPRAALAAWPRGCPALAQSSNGSQSHALVRANEGGIAGRTRAVTPRHRFPQAHHHVDWPCAKIADPKQPSARGGRRAQPPPHPARKIDTPRKLRTTRAKSARHSAAPKASPPGRANPSSHAAGEHGPQTQTAPPGPFRPGPSARARQLVIRRASHTNRQPLHPLAAAPDDRSPSRAGASDRPAPKSARAESRNGQAAPRQP